MISALISANEILPKKGYLKLAEEFFLKIEKKYIKIKFIIVIQKILFLLKIMLF